MTTLKTELQLPKYSAMTDTEAKDSLMLSNISALKSILTHDIRAYLMVSGKWRVIADSQSASAKNAIDAINGFKSFDISNPLYLARLTYILDALIIDNLLTETDKTVILAIGDTLISRAEEIKIGTVTAGQVQAARMT